MDRTMNCMVILSTVFFVLVLASSVEGTDDDKTLQQATNKTTRHVLSDLKRSSSNANEGEEPKQEAGEDQSFTVPNGQHTAQQVSSQPSSSSPRIHTMPQASQFMGQYPSMQYGANQQHFTADQNQYGSSHQFQSVSAGGISGGNTRVVGAAFGGSLYLCSFISIESESCRFVQQPESQYLLLSNQKIKVSGQLGHQAEMGQSHVLTTVNIEFFDEQGRTSAVYSRSILNMQTARCDPETSPVHYRFLDDQSKTIRLVECSSSFSAYLLDDTNHIYIAILPTNVGLWISINMDEKLLGSSNGVMVSGLAWTKTESMMMDDQRAVKGDQMASCSIKSDTSELPESDLSVLPGNLMGGRDMSGHLKRICIDSLNRNQGRSMQAPQKWIDYNELNNRIKLLTMPGSKVPLYLMKTDELSADEFPSLLNSLRQNQQQQQQPHLPRGLVTTQHECMCNEIPATITPGQPRAMWNGRSANRTNSLTIYPHSMLATEENDVTKDVIMRAMLNSGYNTSRPVRIVTSRPIYTPGDEYANYIVRYDADGAKVSKVKRRSLLDMKSTALETETQQPLIEFSLLGWLKDEQHSKMLCDAGEKLKPKRLIVSLNPRSYLECNEDGSDAKVKQCNEKDNTGCEGAYTLTVNV